MQNLILSERQKPRALALYKQTYATHTADPKCGLGKQCPKMIELKAKIQALEDEGVKPSWQSGVE